MSVTKQQLNDGQKTKNIKMSKAQMQLAIIKKKQCDAKALAIVEQLLEPNLNSSWLLQNLGFINKSHMEDVIEERAITKLCGYVLCSKPLTIVIKQQYHISIRRNKVYDVSRLKNFCSSSCYGASDYLLKQMLESPLWLREKEDIPIFQISPVNPMPTRCTPGDEIDVVGINLSRDIDTKNIDNKKESTELGIIEQAKQNASSTVSNRKEENESNSLTDTNSNDVKDIPVNNDLYSLDKACLLELHTEQEGSDFRECVNSKTKHNDRDVKETNIRSGTLETQITTQLENTLHFHESDNRDIGSENKNNITYNIGDSNDTLEIQLSEINSNRSDVSKKLESRSSETSNIEKDNSETLASQSDEINNGENSDNKKIQLRSNEACNSRNTMILPKSRSNEYRAEKKGSKTNKIKKHKQEVSNSVEMQDMYYKLTAHVEQSVKEWVTENTLCLLLNDTYKRGQLLEDLMQQERYQQLCKKLNRLQLQDKQEDRVNLEKNVLKPLPHFPVLQEKGKKMELKVRAFYEGQMTIVSPEDNNNASGNKDTNDSDPILPSIDAHAPNTIRRRIFLDKLNKILPNLLHTLTTNTDTSTITQYNYNNEKCLLIKLLISTFNLSATNIIFKTTEWTLVSLILIKMLSFFDTQLQSSLGSKQAIMYTSMILTSYKLDADYLDRLVMEVLNNVDTERDNK